MAWNKKALTVPSSVLAAPRSKAESMSYHSPDRRRSDHTAFAMTPVMRASSTV